MLKKRKLRRKRRLELERKQDLKYRDVMILQALEIDIDKGKREVLDLEENIYLLNHSIVMCDCTHKSEIQYKCNFCVGRTIAMGLHYKERSGLKSKIRSWSRELDSKKAQLEKM